MENNKKADAKPIVVSKPFLTGDPVDSTVGKTALLFLGGLAACAVLYLIVCGVMTFDNLWLRILLNGAVIFVTAAVYYSSGMSQGSVAVNNGEIMYHRREAGGEVGKEELSRCYHPLKGFITGILGTLPFLIAAIILAIIAKRQYTGLGALPTWVSGVEAREELAAPLVFYHSATSLGLEGVLRVIIRMSLMPFVNIVGSSNPEGLLTLERFSPLLILIPLIAYGIGYTRGVAIRTRVHTDIARNTRKRARKNQKKRRQAQPKGPVQLN